MLILCISFGVTVLDQLTKFFLARNLGVGARIPLLPGLFDLSHVRNTGAAWGMLAGLSHWLVLLSIAMLVGIVVFRRSFMTDTLLHRTAAGLMIGGIVGNLIDRVRLGYVVDFLDFYWRTHHFPSFNVADAAICTGVGLYLLSQALPHAGAGSPAASAQAGAAALGSEFRPDAPEE